ncbi:MAG: cyclic nucleotide-binding domain-containing protein [bacterium]
MKEFKIEDKEIFMMLTSKQVSLIAEKGKVRNYEPGEIIYDFKAIAKDIFFLLEGEVSLRLPGKKDQTPEFFSYEIESIKNRGVFGPGRLFGVERYLTRARAVKRSKVLSIDADLFMKIMKQEKSELVVMSYLAGVYFQRYINTMKELQLHLVDKT